MVKLLLRVMSQAQKNRIRRRTLRWCFSFCLLQLTYRLAVVIYFNMAGYFLFTKKRDTEKKGFLTKQLHGPPPSLMELMSHLLDKKVTMVKVPRGS